MDSNTYSIFDTSLNVWTATREDWAAYDCLRATLKKSGFSFHQDPYIKKRYRSLAKTHHAGNRKDLHFISQIYPAGFEVTFYEDVVRDNPNGGKYHFDKLRKMPYLRRLATLWILRRLTGVLDRMGFSNRTRKHPLDSMEYILARRAEVEAFQGPGFYQKSRESYNATDLDGVLLKDGDLRYFRTSSGHLLRGPVFHNLNNMWWVRVSPFEVRNVGTHELFSYDSCRHKPKEPTQVVEKMKSALKKVVAAENFERAIGIRDALKRAQPSGEKVKDGQAV